MSTATVQAQERTLAFARVIGPYVATFTTVYAIRLPEGLDVVVDLFAQPALALLLGALMLGAGLVVIGVHRSWRGPLAVTVSLFGWFVALRGFLLVVAPAAVQSGAEATLLSPTGVVISRVFFCALAITGLLLTYAGWFTKPTAATP